MSMSVSGVRGQFRGSGDVSEPCRVGDAAITQTRAVTGVRFWAGIPHKMYTCVYICMYIYICMCMGVCV